MTEESTLEELERQLYKTYKESFEDIYLHYFKPIKKGYYQCVAKCCEDEASDLKEHSQCVADCYLTTAGASYYIKSTYEDFKRRFTTCEEKCKNGSGFDPKNNDDEGDDGEITAEELKEKSFADPPGSEFLMDDYFESIQDEDLEHEHIPEKEELDFKDVNTCRKLCIESYLEILSDMLVVMRRDLIASCITKTDLQSEFYDWSRYLEYYYDAGKTI